MFRNLEQIRAKKALEYKGRIGKGENEGENIAKKIPSLIINNGLIATLAFAIEKGKGYGDVMGAIIDHLKDIHLYDVQDDQLHGGQDDLNAFMDFLSSRSSDVLRQLTAETMAFLNYLRRLAV